MLPLCQCPTLGSHYCLGYSFYSGMSTGSRRVKSSCGRPAQTGDRAHLDEPVCHARYAQNPSTLTGAGQASQNTWTSPRIPTISGHGRATWERGGSRLRTGCHDGVSLTDWQNRLAAFCNIRVGMSPLFHRRCSASNSELREENTISYSSTFTRRMMLAAILLCLPPSPPPPPSRRVVPAPRFAVTHATPTPPKIFCSPTGASAAGTRRTSAAP